MQIEEGEIPPLFGDWCNMDIVLKLPKTVKEILLKEYDGAFEEDLLLYYRVPFFPKLVGPGDRCFFSINDSILGYHIIESFHEIKDSFTCLVTGNEWPPGKYLVRKGNSLVKTKGVKMKWGQSQNLF